MRFLVLVLIVGTLFSCNKFNKVLKSNNIEYKYKKTVEYFKAKKYSYVIQLLDNDFFPQLKGSKEFEEAFYMLAYSHYYEKDYFNAENLFRQYAETFSTSDRAVEMAYMRALTYYKQSPKVDLEQTSTYKTIAMMNEFIAKNPNSNKVKEANDIIAICQGKIEMKEYKAAKLYYDMAQYKAASVAFNNMLSLFPESEKVDDYKYMSIKSYYNYALLSVEEKMIERLEQVINDCNDFIDKYPESKNLAEIANLSNNSISKIKIQKNEQITQTNGG
jgi:outer membrane protein assembly factor BamD